MRGVVGKAADHDGLAACAPQKFRHASAGVGNISLVQKFWIRLQH
jgi:hypothetical protein